MGLTREASEQEDPPRIHQVVRVQRAFDGAHQAKGHR